MLVTDPPYGIGESLGKNKWRGKLAVARDYGCDSWDKETADEQISMAASVTAEQVIFGGNYYCLPPTSCWLIWDKVNGGNDFADCELAWTNLKRAVRLKRHQWNGMLRQGKETRFHPTQKPRDVMRWAIEFTTGGTVLDPFMGSGTTLVACKDLGRRGIGIELEEKYCEIAANRLRQSVLDFGEPA